MREIKESAYLYEALEDNTMKMRAKNSLNWFIRRAVIHKRCYYAFATASIITPLTFTLLNSVDTQMFLANDFKQYSAVLGMLTTASTSLLALFRFKDRWQEYRETAEIIKAELVAYQMKSGDYETQDIAKLSERIEQIIAESNEDQRKIVAKEGQAVKTNINK